MIHDSNGTFAFVREFLGYMVLGLCTVFGTASLADIGINPHSGWFFWTFLLAPVFGAAFGIVAYGVMLVFNLHHLGRLGELLVGVIVGTLSFAMASGTASMNGFGMTIDSIGGAIAGGIILTSTVCILATLTGRIRWHDEPLWFVRMPSYPFPSQPLFPPVIPVRNDRIKVEKPMPDPRDDRTFEATFDKPTNLRFEHNGKTVYDSRVQGHVFLRLSDFCPYEGVVTVYLDDEPFAEITAD